jgi:hypothetical protein
MIRGVSTATMGISEERAWDRIQGGLLRGILYGGVVGAIVGLIIGAIVFHGLGAILTSMLAGVIGAGGLGAFWGVLSGLESPDPGNEPGDVERPLDVPELTSEEHGRRLPRDG